jgi:hypothetical protein
MESSSTPPPLPPPQSKERKSIGVQFEMKEHEREKYDRLKNDLYKLQGALEVGDLSNELSASIIKLIESKTKLLNDLEKQAQRLAMARTYHIRVSRYSAMEPKQLNGILKKSFEIFHKFIVQLRAGDGKTLVIDLSPLGRYKSRSIAAWKTIQDGMVMTMQEIKGSDKSDGLVEYVNSILGLLESTSLGEKYRIQIASKFDDFLQDYGFHEDRDKKRGYQGKMTNQEILIMFILLFDALNNEQNTIKSALLRYVDW